MVILDAAIVNVALPSIRRELGFTPTALPWVVNGCLLTFAGFMLLGAWSAAGGMAGAVAGGAITTGLSWRWVFLINVPIGAVLQSAGHGWADCHRDVVFHVAIPAERTRLQRASSRARADARGGDVRGRRALGHRPATASLASTSSQVGGSVGLAALATAASAAAGGSSPAAALAAGYDLVFLMAAGISLAIAVDSVLLPKARTAAPERADPAYRDPRNCRPGIRRRTGGSEMTTTEAPCSSVTSSRSP